MLGLLTASIIKDLQPLGYSPQMIASAVALMVGFYCLFVGLFKLGFLFDFVSEPVLSGFICAAALVIILSQIPSLLGLTNVGSGTAATVHDVVTMLPLAQWRTSVVGLTGIMLLVGLQLLGKSFGKKSKFVWGVRTARAAIVVLLYTGISFAVNRSDPKKPLFAVSAVRSSGIPTPRIPELKLLKKVATKAIAPFIAASLEVSHPFIPFGGNIDTRSQDDINFLRLLTPSTTSRSH
jgi:sodium-independent sulfate anion transporter 11